MNLVFHVLYKFILFLYAYSLYLSLRGEVIGGEITGSLGQISIINHSNRLRSRIGVLESSFFMQKSLFPGQYKGVVSQTETVKDFLRHQIQKRLKVRVPYRDADTRVWTASQFLSELFDSMSYFYCRIIWSCGDVHLKKKKKDWQLLSQDFPLLFIYPCFSSLEISLKTSQKKNKPFASEQHCFP